MNERDRNSGLLLGFDIGGTKCAVIVGSSDGGKPVVLAREAFATEQGPDATLSRLCALAHSMLASQGAGKVRGIGISCGGPLDSATGRVLSPPNLPGWDDVAVAAFFAEAFQVPARLENDANACALAEWMWGAGTGTRNMVFLTFGTGMGAGLILNGNLYRGANDLAGEIGHSRIAEDGPACYGKRGSFEGLCSGAGIAKMASEHPGLPIDAVGIFRAAVDGDERAARIVSRVADSLGTGIALLIDILNPEAVVIGSIFARQESLLRPGMEAAIRREALPGAARVCRILPSRLGDTVGDFAALAIASQSCDSTSLNKKS